jgi:membrane protein YdbS with pleckstrin-like domain
MPKLLLFDLYLYHMPFSNISITPEELPQASDIDWLSPDERYKRLLKLEWRLTAFCLFAIAAIVFYFAPNWRQPAITGSAAAVLAAILVLYWLAIEIGWRWRGYVLREHDIAYRGGWIFRHRQFCPIARIQNVSLNRGPLERRYGLSTLRLFTAGNDGADLSLPGLAEGEAERIREYLLARVHGK